MVYTNDKDGNTLSEKGLRYEASYQYNGQNRMAHSVVTSHVEKTHTVNDYAYDALGRRTLTENVTGQTLRILYDGKGFEAIREGETFRDGSFTTRYATAGAASNAQSNQATGERYRWVGDNESARTRNPDDGYTVQSSRYNGRGVTLYGNGEAVAVSYSSSGVTRSMYMGKDVMGSVRSVTVDTGTLEGRYEYDAFGQPYKGDLTGGMNLGYASKPYDSATGLYNYGYRDYKPQAARFTTIDPIRDGNNWYAYVNNDPVNWRDLWGLSTVDVRSSNGLQPQVPYDPKDYHCDIYAYNGALAMGLNPKGQDGTAWDGNELKVAQIYDQYYQNNRTSTPIPGTSGYVFMEFKDEVPGHMELYVYSGNGNTYTRYKTDGIETPYKDQEKLGTGERIFVPLTGSKNGNTKAFVGGYYEL